MRQVIAARDDTGVTPQAPAVNPRDEDVTTAGPAVGLVHARTGGARVAGGDPPGLSLGLSSAVYGSSPEVAAVSEPARQRVRGRS